MNIPNKDSIAYRIAKVHEQIRQFEAAAHRTPGSVQMLAVSKTRGVEDIRQAIAAGCQQFAESYVQEAVKKIHQIGNDQLVWHFIGPIQSNKTRLIAENFDWVHSVDRLKLAQRLHEQRPAHLKPLQVCVQINISGEKSKSGMTEEDLVPFLLQCESLRRLRIRGLMTVPPKSDSEQQQRACFARLRQLQEQLHQQHNRPAGEIDTLSMGMSGDLSLAIAEGATMVRVGTAIFGKRSV